MLTRAARTGTAAGRCVRRHRALAGRGGPPAGRRAGEWIQHAEGVLSTAQPETPSPVRELAGAGRGRGGHRRLVRRVAELGLVFGPAFGGLRRLWRAGDEVSRGRSCRTTHRTDRSRYIRRCWTPRRAERCADR